MTSSSNELSEAAPSAPPHLLFSSINKTFRGARGDDTLALKDISLEVPNERFVVLLGPSGCGKTTLLRLANGLIRPDSGTILVDGKAPEPGPETGFMFQSYRLIPWETSLGNVEFALRGLPLAPADRRERAMHYVELVGLGKFAGSYPSELSGGMKQRIALARALAGEPHTLLMDEPFASIDAQTRELMQIELMRLWSLRRATVIFVTHSVDEAILLADDIVLMAPRPGRILETISVDLPRPRWTYDLHAEPRYIELRAYLWDRMRDLVRTDPGSDFYGRDFSSVHLGA